MNYDEKTEEKQFSIYDVDADMLADYYSLVERQGPGSPETTLRALSFVEGLDENSRIADVGCGTGGQTVVLAENVRGQITAVDVMPRFVDILNTKAKEWDLRITGVVGSMDDLKFGEGSLDLIWSEGAIYNIGYERGLREWRRFLKKGGYVAVTEASWFTDERPKEIHDFWMGVEPGIDTIPNKVRQMQEAGYVPVASFIIPENCWTDGFFVPQVKAREEFLKKYAGNAAAEEFMRNEVHEAELYEKYKEFYGYAFYIGRKI